MNSTQQNSVSRANNNSHYYRNLRSIITVVLWGLALATHAILIPRLVRELYGDFVKHRT